MSMEELETAVARSQSGFAPGTIVTWVSSDRFHYAAICTPVGWYTTASDRAVNTGIGKVVGFGELLEIVARPETTGVRVIGLKDGQALG